MRVRPEPFTRDRAETLALQALAWIIGDPDRAERLLRLTGLEPDEIRRRAGDPALLGGILDFLMAHEPDLLVCAEEIGVPPDSFQLARPHLPG